MYLTVALNHSRNDDFQSRPIFHQCPKFRHQKILRLPSSRFKPTSAMLASLSRGWPRRRDGLRRPDALGKRSFAQSVKIQKMRLKYLPRSTISIFHRAESGGIECILRTSITGRELHVTTGKKAASDASKVSQKIQIVYEAERDSGVRFRPSSPQVTAKEEGSLAIGLQSARTHKN